MVTADQVREFINYDPETGIFTWKKKPNRKIRIGDIAGFVNGLGYSRIHVLGKTYQGHRLAWLIMTGDFPKYGIDHINGIRDDNRWINLRDVPQVDNGRNQKRKSTNTSGITGVSWWEKRKKWQAYIKVDGIRIHLGLFSDFDTAASVRKSAEQKYGFHQNHGRNM